MRLTFKPAKCRSLSILSGRPKPVNFFLTDPNSGQRVTSKTDSHKFLGAVVTHHNTASVRKTIVLLELTCPFDSSESSFKAALDRKTLRYCRLEVDCKKLGYTSYNTPFEDGPEV